MFTKKKKLRRLKEQKSMNAPTGFCLCNFIAQKLWLPLGPGMQQLVAGVHSTLAQNWKTSKWLWNLTSAGAQTSRICTRLSAWQDVVLIKNHGRNGVWGMWFSSFQPRDTGKKKMNVASRRKHGTLLSHQSWESWGIPVTWLTGSHIGWDSKSDPSDVVTPNYIGGGRGEDSSRGHIAAKVSLLPGLSLRFLHVNHLGYQLLTLLKGRQNYLRSDEAQFVSSVCVKAKCHLAGDLGVSHRGLIGQFWDLISKDIECESD